MEDARRHGCIGAPRETSNDMIVDAVKCNVCSDLIYLRSQKDMRWCSCGGTFLMYPLALYEEEFKLKKIEVPHTEQELYDDWNLRLNKLGVILGYEVDSRSQEDLTLRDKTILGTGESRGVS